MLSLRRFSALLLTLLLLAQPVRATWSILIIDVTTGEVAVGIATCLTGFDLKPNTIVVVPGQGVAAAQSFVGPLSLRELIRNGIRNGTTAQQILQQLAIADSGHQTRQYGIASLVGGEITFTGTGAGAWAGGVTGQIGNLRYTVQGNVLTGAPVVTAAEQAILNTPGSIAEKLMVAMEAAASMGGDGRCSCNANNPTACGAPPPSFTKSAHIGLMVVSRPSDVDLPCTPAQGCGAGVYWMDLNVANQNANAPDAVVQLRQRYDTWRAQQVGRADHFQSTVTLSGNRIRANGFDTITGTVTLRDASGALLGNSLPVTVGLSNRSTVPSATFSAVTPQPNGTYTFTLRGNLDPGTAIVDVAVNDAFGRVGIWPQPTVTIDDLFGPCGVSAIPDGQGGVLPALRVNGSSGVNRRTSVGYAQPFTLSLEAPAGVPPTPPAGLFLLWAHLGVPQPNIELPLGPNLGSLCFTPAPFAIAPTVLIADSFGIGGYAGWGPAPFSVQIPGIPALIDLTLQGAMAIDPQAQFAATNALHLTVTPLPPPVVSTITPSAPTPGQTVTITGASFQVGLEVAIDNVPVSLLTRTPTSATFAMPSGVRCDAQISLRNPGSSAVVRTINATPIITSMPNASGPAAGGMLFFVSGQNLESTTVTFNGVPMTITSRSAASIFGRTPPGTPGPAVVLFQNPNGCQTTRTYTYL
ncbi:MAG: DUF1028 domain-containing protein [Planctomycetes bacterium]|nr:DUF1028 domain-containing protein [Planctomycetota bacterium]